MKDLFGAEMVSHRRSGKAKREELFAWKEEHKVETNGNGNDAGKWIAVSIPAARECLKGYVEYGDKNDSIMILMMNFCRLLDEANQIGEGPTERAACMDLACKIGIPRP